MTRILPWVCLTLLQACWGGYLAEGARPESSIGFTLAVGYVDAPLATKRVVANPKPPDDGVDSYPNIGDTATGVLSVAGRYAPSPYVQLSLGVEAGLITGPGVFGSLLPGVKVLLTPPEPALPLYLALAVRGTFLGAIQGDYSAFSVLGGEAFLPVSWVISPGIELYWAPEVGFEHHTVSSSYPRPADWGNYDYVTEYVEEFMWAGGVVGLLWRLEPGGAAIGFEVYGGNAVAGVLDGAGGWRLGLAVSFRIFSYVFGVAPDPSSIRDTEIDEPKPQGVLKF
jgi:hypothetical protein